MIVIWQNPRQVGGGMIGAIAVGAVLYALIPRPARPSATTAGQASTGVLAAEAIADKTARDRNGR